ncbi:polymer-forming cytoskeletal protein [Chitinophagaceae bacterium LWZ2-11]
MFTQKNQSTTEAAPSSGRTGIIGTGMVITGNVNTESDVRVDGKLIGNIHSTARVVIGAGGSIEGNIFAANADITGTVKGNIVTKDLLNLRNNAVVKGDVEAGKLAMEPNAIFNGHCKTGSAVTNAATVSTSAVNLQVVEMVQENTNERRLAAAK